MPRHEFDIIADYFQQQSVSRPDVRLGIGDDAAIVSVPAGFDCVIAMDTLNEGIHFFPDCPPEDIGYKALAVNLSDLAAMGAKPAWMTLSLALPTADDDWLRDFSRGLFDCAKAHQVQLIGGDLSQGPLSVCITVQALIEAGHAIQRKGAQLGDGIYLSGPIGRAAYAVDCLKKGKNCDANSLQALQRPQPRVALGRALLNKATAAIDISDGLLQDLSHLLKASQVGAKLHIENLPCDADKIDFALKGGDDFELCFTMPNHYDQDFADYGIHKIGVITDSNTLSIFHHGDEVEMSAEGYQHF